MKLDEMKLDLWRCNTIADYAELLTSNPRTTIGFTLAADIIYAARNGAIKRSEARGGDEWRTIALNLKRKYGESLSVDEVRSEMSPAKIAAAILGKSRTPKKTAAARKNARLGGRPVKRVQLINPWSGAMPEDKNLAWDEIRAWAQGHVHPDDLPGWLRRARQAFRDNDGAALGTMIIGS